ncbi:MAG: hypothetical protein LC792_16805 [Actinobacteria bacterium]|nr:hypothetical protein [Actinomycetota bacterium]
MTVDNAYRAHRGLRDRPSVAADGPELRALRAELEAFGLPGNEALALLGLLRLGSANTAQLAGLSGISRTNVYKLLEALVAKGLAEQVPIDGPATWASFGQEETLNRLCAAQEERLRELVARGERLRHMLAAALPSPPSGPMAHVHVLHKATETGRIYQELVAEAETEILAMVRAPFAWDRWSKGDLPESPWAGPLRRGVAVRTLYEMSALERSTGSLRDGLGPSVEAGEQARLVGGELPLKLSVFDRRVALLAMADSPSDANGFPTTMLVEHPGFALLQARAFDQLWTEARPYQQLDPAGPGAAGAAGAAGSAGSALS